MVAVLPIPAVDREEHVWVPSSRGLYSRSEVRRQTGKCESTVPARIADWNVSLPSELSADLEDATRALHEFDRFSARNLGHGLAAIAPMTAILLRTESASSSQIEQLTVSAKQLALAEIGAGDSPNSRTVLGNVRALEAAVELADELSLDTLIAVHRELLQHQRGMEPHAGELRTELVWIGKGSAGPLRADFVAPQHEHIRGALNDLFEFTDRPDLPALLQIAVTHAQFETIHPFVDGNGRTGRALVQAQLRVTGLVEHALAPLSAGLLRDLPTYFAALDAYREGDAAPIIRVFTQAARFASVSGRQLIELLDEQIRESRELLTGVRQHAGAMHLLPHLIAQPIVTSGYVTKLLNVSEATAQRALSTLVERDVLVERTGKRRGRIWQHDGILGVLDDYAESIRR